mmetsp:Transcript_62796/g.70241  ORF Transcript_62796/g.70241 Transcript_62796/m.70241 type:complete len:471 (+) Transcript_62796:62-1474(+)
MMMHTNIIADIAYDDNEDFLGPSPMQFLPYRTNGPETRDAAPSSTNNNRPAVPFDVNKTKINIKSPLDADWATTGNSNTVSSWLYDPTSLVGASFARSAYDARKMVNDNGDPIHTNELDITMRSLKELTTSCSKLLYKDLPNGVQSFVDTTRGKSNKLSLLQCSSHPNDVPEEEEEAACMDTVMNCTATTINSMNSINDDADDLNNNSSMIDNNNDKHRNNNNTKNEEGTEAIMGVDDDGDDDDKNKYDDTITWTKKKHDYVEDDDDDVDTNNNNKMMMKTKEYSNSHTNNSSKSVTWTKKHGFIEEDVYTNTQMMKTKQYSNNNINNSMTSDYCRMMSEHCEQKLASLKKEETVVTPQKMKQRAKTISGVFHKKYNTTGTSMSSLNNEETVVTPNKMKPRATSPSKLLRKRFTTTGSSLLSLNKNNNKNSTNSEREKTPRRQRKKRLSITASPLLSWATRTHKKTEGRF